MDEPKKIEWGKIASWIIIAPFFGYFIWNIGTGEIKKWETKLINQGIERGAKIQQENINNFIVGQLKEKGVLRILLSNPEGKNQEIILKPVVPSSTAQ